ncbi:winged helix-turn-helix domain-containing protein [Arthrobacter sp. zg-Y820]|uniref:ArsR/SmtB family transcription factor n=1 Tax=unclassified Arthrobacter TaxID=235627 RepID=UPI001E2EDC96|nr:MULTISPECIES: winged helix-turn-helix domain-containing protein [unclassified Arthrobacter]MCC9195361.1 winged helix-turn-helix domain-containing protein [Arthrobacter sp. zg-Y820]MDK1278220.1 winged helix-turn-helix domain-containing protein [Arthrobacter sp. zg.Y820]WIB10101.1 winged helix-turn-helix domain-containing protein [Arthrobacter sp. zg-Y820]
MVSEHEGRQRALEARLQAVEARVAALERRAQVREPPSDAGEESDIFWALNGVRERYPDPGAVLFAGTAGTAAGARYEYQYGLETAHLLDVDWTRFADSLASLGHPVRLAILRAVLDGTETVSGLVEELGSGTSGQIYHHVHQLTAAGWLAPHARSRYRIPPARVIPLLAILTAVTGGN